MKVIVCTGDSHTWGQGALGAVESIKTVECGERRPIPFSIPSYVNEIRKAVEEKTNSGSFEITYNEMKEQNRETFGLDCIVVNEDNPYEFSAEGEVFALFYYAEKEGQGVKILCDGKEVAVHKPTRFGTKLSYNRVVFKASKGEHKITVLPLQSECYIHRIEGYFGDYAVINSGIGSCPASRYLDEFWDECITVLDPKFAIVEPHTINDWLSRKTPKEYYDTLIEYFTRLKNKSVQMLMLTVAPIYGPTAEPHGDYDFSEYSEMAKKAAEDFGVPMADSNAVLVKETEGLSEEEKFALTADDNWHPNTHGHAVYAKMAMELTEKLNWF